MSDPFIGEIRAFPYTFAPVGWHLCDGSSIAIQANPALAAILGTTYNTSSTPAGYFSLPNLNNGNTVGLAMLGAGQGVGLSNYNIGAKTGAATVTLNAAQMPSHNHTITGVVSTQASSYPLPTSKSHLGRYIKVPTPDFAYTNQALTGSSHLDPAALTPAGTAAPAPHENAQPYLAFAFCIATTGIFPTRN